MELIPVFSLIVLVATISTFILAVGAYIMFRVRESRYRPGPTRSAPTFDADVFAPEPIPPTTADDPTGGIVRRESVRDPRVMRFPRESLNPEENPSQNERRTWR